MLCVTDLRGPWDLIEVECEMCGEIVEVYQGENCSACGKPPVDVERFIDDSPREDW